MNEQEQLHESNHQDNNAAPAETLLQSANSLASNTPSKQFLEDAGPQAAPEEEQQQFEVVTNKAKHTIDQEQIFRLFRAQQDKQDHQRKIFENNRKESAAARLKNKPSEAKSSTVKKPANDYEDENHDNQNTSVLELSNEKSKRIKTKIEKMTAEYKSMHRPSTFDCKLQKYRYECKQKLFFNCCYGVHELLELSPEELNQAEKSIIAGLTSQSPVNFTHHIYSLCKKLTNEIDIEMLKALNKSSKFEISRDYKEKWDVVLANVRDEANFQLRRKIIDRSFPTKSVPYASELEFFTTAKRQETIEKQKRYIAEFSVETSNNPEKAGENEEVTFRSRIDSIDQGKKEEAVSRPVKSFKLTNKYLEENSVTVLEEMISEKHLKEMRDRLSEDLSGKTRDFMLSNFKNVFAI